MDKPQRQKQLRAGHKLRSKDPFRATLGELLPYLFAQRKLLIAALFFGVLGAITALLQPVLVGQTIETVQQNQPLGMLVWLLFACVIASATFSGIEHYVLQRMGEGVVLRSRRELISKLLFLPISQFDQRRHGDLVSRVGSDTSVLRAVLTQGLVEAMASSLLLVGSLIGMLLLDAVLFLVTVAVLLLALFTVVIISLKMRPLVTATQQQVGDLAASVDRAVAAIRTIRAAGASQREADAITREAEKAYGLGLRVARLSALIVPVSFIAMQLCFIVVLGLGGYRVATGAISIAALVSFIIFVFLLIGPLGQMFGAVSSVNQALGALGRIQEIIRLETESELDKKTHAQLGFVTLTNAQVAATAQRVEVASLSPVDLDTSDTTSTTIGMTETAVLAGGASAKFADFAPQGAAALPQARPLIEFDNVSFTYRSAAPDRVDARALVDKNHRQRYVPPEIVETPVLHNVSFAVPQGSRVALVGPSGAGKSTILGLIERFNDPDDGVIRFAGVDLRQLSRAELRAQLGYVEQDAPVLAGTLRDNLLLAAPEATDAECEAVLRRVNLGGLLDRQIPQATTDVENQTASSSSQESSTANLADTTADMQQVRGLDMVVGEHGVLLSGGRKAASSYCSCAVS